MSIRRASLPWLIPLPRGGRSRAAGLSDADDGIHVVSVTTVDSPNGPVLRVVVTWRAAGVWVERTVEVAE